jgi:ornithine carbamoyltransferase
MDINRYTPCFNIKQKHMTNLGDFPSEAIFELLYATKAMKDKFIAHEDTAILNGVTVALLFGDTSLRTRSALEIGIRQLGGSAIDLPYSHKDMLAGENITDVVNVIARYGVGALVTRGIDQATLESYTAVSPIPIINSTNDDYVPMQTICDLYTIWEKKHKLEGLKIAYIGKGTNIAASLVMGSVKCGLEVTVATPNEFPIKQQSLDRAEQYGTITITDDPHFAAKNADIIYTDSYHYHEQITEQEAEILRPYKINNSLMSSAKEGALFMHPLPANRGVEVTADIIDGKNSIVYDQAENRLHSIKAILAMLIN